MERRKCTYTLFWYLLYLCLSDGFVFLYCRGWTYGPRVRNPNSILGVLVRENFPGLVQMPGPDEVPQPGLFWEHYRAAPAPPETTINGVECHTRADMVINGFWVISVSHNKILIIASWCTHQCCLVLLQVYYKVDESKEQEAADVIVAEATRLLQNTRHEMRVQAVRDYYAKQGRKRSKKDCRKKFLTKAQYMTVTLLKSSIVCVI
jgi:hypothetical protein